LNSDEGLIPLVGSVGSNRPMGLDRWMGEQLLTNL